jgi:hypothetical protein
MLDLPVHQQDLDFPEEKIIQGNRGNGHQKTDGGGLQGQSQTDHDLAGVHNALLPKIIKGEHDAQNRAQQSNIGGVAADSGDQVEFPGQLLFQTFFIRKGIRLNMSEKKKPFKGNPDGNNAQKDQSPYDPIVYCNFKPGHRENIRIEKKCNLARILFYVPLFYLYAKIDIEIKEKFFGKVKNPSDGQDNKHPFISGESL